MAVTKLSISFDVHLAAAVREAARAEGVPVSTWLADAAAAKVRNTRLGEALRADAPEVAAMSDEELDALVTEARRNSMYTGRRESA